MQYIFGYVGIWYYQLKGTSPILNLFIIVFWILWWREIKWLLSTLIIYIWQKSIGAEKSPVSKKSFIYMYTIICIAVI